MRILHVVARSHARGAELAAFELSEELDALGHQNRVVALGRSHDRRTDPNMPPLVARSGTSLDVLFLAAWRLRRLLRADPADVVMAHGGWPAQVTAVAVPRGGPLLVWQRILGFPPELWGPTRRVWWRIVIRRVDAAVALTTDLEQELRQLGFAGPVWVIPNARRPERFEAIDRTVEGAALRAGLELAGDAPVIGFVGHLVDQKQPERAVEVLAEVRRRGVPAHLVIAGDGPLHASVVKTITACGVGAHVTLLGHRADVERIYGGIDLCLMTSAAEGIPGVAIEAQMAGSPVISFPVGGVAEVIEDGVTGYVLPRASVTDMATATISLLQDDTRRLEMGAEARRRTPLFSANRTALVYAEQLKELDASRHREPARGAVALAPRPPSATGRTTERVLHVIATDDRRGAETFATLLHQEMITAGLDSSIVAVRHGSVGNLPIEVIGGKHWFPTALARVRRRAADADIVIAHGSVSLPVVVLSGVARRTPVVYRSIGDPTAWQTTPLRRARTRQLLARCRHIVSVWEGGRRHLMRMYGIDPERITVIPNAYDDRVFTPFDDAARATARDALGLGEGPIVAYVGALTPEKRPHDALAAVALLPGTRLLVVGDGPLGPDLRRHAPDTVIFLGAVSDVRNVYAAADVILQTSQTEGMSAVLLEAAACGRPVVTTDVGAAREIVLGGVTGEVVAVGDVDALAQAITRTLADQEIRGAEAARRATSAYGVATVTDLWIDQLDRLLA